MESVFDAFLLLGLLNSYIVKRQMRTKQFTRDVIDTMGQRFKEVIIPIPRSIEIKREISNRVRAIINNRVEARDVITDLARQIVF